MVDRRYSSRRSPCFAKPARARDGVGATGRATGRTCHPQAAPHGFRDHRRASGNSNGEEGTAPDETARALIHYATLRNTLSVGILGCSVELSS
jgi:hypothetical protein